MARRVDQEGYKQVQRSLGDMQSQIARLNQDLSFYRGLVQPDSLVHVKVQQMQIVPETAGGQYRLKFVLMQTGKPDKEVSGSASIAIDGLRGGKPQSLDFAEISPTRRVEPGILVSLLRGLRRDRPTAARDSSRPGSESSSTAARIRVTRFGRRSSGRRRACRSRWKPTGALPPRMVQMFKRKPNNNATIDTLDRRRRPGSTAMSNSQGGFHLDGYINGNVTCAGGRRRLFVGERARLHRRLGVRPQGAA